MKRTSLDKAIFREFNKGNVSAFTNIYEHFYKPIYFFAKSFVDDPAQAQDIVSESFMKLWLKHSDFANMDNVKAFLYITTRNACMDFLRFAKRSALTQKEMRYLSDEGEPSIDFDIINAEIIHEIYLQIENLPNQCAEVFKLSFYEGKKTEEIAQLLSIAKQTVLNQKAKAIKLLRASLLKRNILPAALPVLNFTIVHLV